MKKTWQKALLCGGILLSLSMSAYAAELYADGHYQAADQTFTVSGSVDAPNTMLTMTVLPYDTDLSDITMENAEEKMIAVSAPNADQNGDFSASIGLPSSIGGGMYKIILRYADAESEIWFSYFKKQNAAPVLSQINQAQNAGAIKTILLEDENAAAVGMNHALVVRYGDTIAKYLYQNRPQSLYDTENFSQYAIGALAMGQVCSGDVQPSVVIQRFASSLGLSYAKDAKPYGAGVQNEIARLMQKTAWDGQNFSDFYHESLLLARINMAESNLSLKEIVLAGSDALGLDMRAYEALQNDYQKNQVYAALMGKKYESYKAVRDAFAAACQTASGLGGNSGSIGGGGGGASSGGGGGLITNVPEKNEDSAKTALFPDMKAHWAETEVRTLAEKGIIHGFADGTFRPEQPVSRAEFAKMLCGVFDVTENEEHRMQFDDVLDTDWYAPYVLRLAENEIIQGYGGKFMPEDAIARQDAAVMLMRAAKMQGRVLEGTMYFDDESQIADYAKNAVSSLSRAGIFKGYEGKFRPLEQLTRAEAAAMLLRMYDLLQ